MKNQQQNIVLDEVLEIYKWAYTVALYSDSVTTMQYLVDNNLHKGICYWYMMKRKECMYSNYTIPLELWSTGFFCPTPEDLLVGMEYSRRKYYRKGLMYYKIKTVADTLLFRIKVLEQLKKYGAIYLWML